MTTAEAMLHLGAYNIMPCGRMEGNVSSLNGIHIRTQCPMGRLMEQNHRAGKMPRVLVLNQCEDSM